MALSANDIATLTALRNGREDDVAIVRQIQDELAEVAKLMVPLSVAHSRAKLYWKEGENLSVFSSRADGDQVNGWYCVWTGYEATFPERPESIVGLFEVQHLYEYDFGDNTHNSQRQFEENCSAFVAAFQFHTGIKALAGKRFLGFAGAQAGISDQTKPPAHLFRTTLRFELCRI